MEWVLSEGVLSAHLNMYVHLFNLSSDISAYGTVVKPQRTAMLNAKPVYDTYGRPQQGRKLRTVR